MKTCYLCQSSDIEQQFGGFDFCHACLPLARDRGVFYWHKLYRALYPWRLEA